MSSAADKQAARQALAERTFGTLCDTRWGGIFADPAWRFETRTEDGGYARGPDRHYRTMTVDEIAALPVDRLAAHDCGLVMFGTFPMLDQARLVMDAWGFRYVTGGVWLKTTKDGTRPKMGTGYRLRTVAEPFLVGVRGNPPVKDRAVQNLIAAPAREHSRKPDEARTLLERLFDGPYLELFQRGARPGWGGWGDERGRFD